MDVRVGNGLAIPAKDADIRVIEQHDRVDEVVVRTELRRAEFSRKVAQLLNCQCNRALRLAAGTERLHISNRCPMASLQCDNSRSAGAHILANRPLPA